MGIDYSIKIKLDAEYTKSNIFTILHSGSQKQFIYYDQIDYEQYINVPILNAQQSTEKIFNAYENNIEGGPGVYTALDRNSTAMLWFHKTEDDFILFHIGAIGAPRKKDYYIDFVYYIKLFFDICDNFIILEIKAYSW